MKNQYSRMDNICPKEPKKLRIPDQIDLYMEDGTVYHVRSFFAGDMTDGRCVGCPDDGKVGKGAVNPSTLPSGINSGAVV